MVILALRVYRRWFTRFTPACTLEPSCSLFALESVRRYGSVRGLQLVLDRMPDHR